MRALKESSGFLRSCAQSCRTRQLACAYGAGVLRISHQPFLPACTDEVSQRDHVRVTELANRLLNLINGQVTHVVRNGDPAGYPGCVNLSFSYVEGESLLMALKVHPFLPTSLSIHLTPSR